MVVVARPKRATVIGRRPAVETRGEGRRDDANRRTTARMGRLPRLSFENVIKYNGCFLSAVSHGRVFNLAFNRHSDFHPHSCFASSEKERGGGGRCRATVGEVGGHREAARVFRKKSLKVRAGDVCQK